MLPGTLLGGVFAASSAEGRTLSFQEHQEDASNSSSYSFTNVDFGEANPNRSIVVVVGTDDGTGEGNVSGVTIGGVTATQVVSNNYDYSFSSRTHCSIWIADVPSGATGTVVVTTDNTTICCGISVYRLNDLASTTAADTANSNTSSSTSLDVDVLIDDFIIAGGMTGGAAASWTGVTEDHDSAVEGSNHSTASHIATSNETPRTVTGNLPGGGAAVCAVFR